MPTFSNFIGEAKKDYTIKYLDKNKNISSLINTIDLINESKRNSIKASLKNKINKHITKIGKEYYNNIPLETIFDILDYYDIVALQEDNTEWNGMLVGNEAQVYFNLAYKNSFDGKRYQPFTNTMLALSYYKMSSGRYEIVTYLT